MLRIKQWSKDRRSKREELGYIWIIWFNLKIWWPTKKKSKSWNLRKRMTIQNTCGEEKLDFFLRKCRVITTMDCIHSTINTINCSNSVIIYFKDVKCMYTCGMYFWNYGWVCKPNNGPKKWHRKKGYIHVWGASLRARFESFGPISARKARQQLSLTSTITCTDRLPYTKTYKTNMKSTIKMEKIIRSMKDNKAIFILQNP